MQPNYLFSYFGNVKWIGNGNKSIFIFKLNCEAQGKGRAKGRPRMVFQRSFIDGGCRGVAASRFVGRQDLVAYKGLVLTLGSMITIPMVWSM